MTIFIKRIYAPAAVNDGWRVLVDRLWPRGVRREETAPEEKLPDMLNPPRILADEQGLEMFNRAYYR